MTNYPILSFAYGEISQKYQGRIDAVFYTQGCRTLENMFALPTGSAEKRPGTIYANTGKTAGKKVLLIPWIISPTEGRILEFGVSYIRYYKDGVILGAPYETVTTYTEAELPDIRVAQISNYMYIVHPSHKVAKLTRTSDSSWALADVTFTAGAGEETFSSATHYPSHVEVYEDRLILARTTLKPGTFWGSRVGNYENFSLRRSSNVTVTIATPGVVSWTAHGLTANATVVFTTTGALPTGLTPGVVYYVVGASITTDSFQLSLAGGGVAIDTTGTQSGVHTLYASPPLATDAWEKTPQAKSNNEILWLLAEDAFLFGTSSGPFRVGGKEQILTGDGAWWPQRQASVGSANVQALMVDDMAIFAGKGGKHIYRFQYSEPSDKYVPDDITFLCEHLVRKGVTQFAHQGNPKTILWSFTSDGVLLSGCYSRVTNTIGWSPHDLYGEVESMAIIPTDDEDEVWVSVNRTIGGSEVRHIEYFAAHEWDDIEDYHGVDSAVVWDGGDPVVVTSITNTNPSVCTTPTVHGFSNDYLIRFKDVTGITDVNDEVYTVKNSTTYTFQLYTRDGSTAIDFSGESVSGFGGTVERVTNTVTGLTHLNGETVNILSDGSVAPSEIVSGGQITLEVYGNKIRVGLGFTSVLEPMDIAQSSNKLKRGCKIFGKFYKTADAQVGPDEDSLVQVVFDGIPTMDEPQESQTVGTKFMFDGFAGYDGKIRIESENPLPLTVCSLVVELVGEQ